MSQTKYPDCSYRVSAKAIILIDNKLLLIRENGNNWDLPGGGIEHLEELEDALIREVWEEVELAITRIDNKSVMPWLTYDFDKGWEKPILYLVYNVSVTGRPKESPSTVIGLFDKDKIMELSFEKHLEKFKPSLISAAFENGSKQ